LSMRAATQRCDRSPRSYGALWNKFASIAAEPRDHAVHQQRIICGTVDLGDNPVLDAGPGPAPGRGTLRPPVTETLLEQG